MKHCILFLLLFCSFETLTAQNKQLVGTCEGCEAIFEYGDKVLSSRDTLPGFYEEAEKLLLHGTIYQSDGITPAAGVILYIYHTDSKGKYLLKGNESGWGKRHGAYRGWIKSDREGKYEFYTSKPGLYPSRNSPAHIHPTVLEPNGKYYWLSEIIFEGEPLVPKAPAGDHVRGGGSESIKLQKQKGALFEAKRDFVLGKNVPDYER